MNFDLFFFVPPDLPCRYISVSFSGVSDLMDILLSFYIIGCLAPLHLRRMLSFGQPLLQRSPSSRFNYSLT